MQMRRSNLKNPEAVLKMANHLQLSSKSWASKSEILRPRRLYHQPELFISIAKSYLVLRGRLLDVKKPKKMYHNYSQVSGT